MVFQFRFGSIERIKKELELNRTLKFQFRFGSIESIDLIAFTAP